MIATRETTWKNLYPIAHDLSEKIAADFKEAFGAWVVAIFGDVPERVYVKKAEWQKIKYDYCFYAPVEARRAMQLVFRVNQSFPSIAIDSIALYSRPWVRGYFQHFGCGLTIYDLAVDWLHPGEGNHIYVGRCREPEFEPQEPRKKLPKEYFALVADTKP